MVTKMDSDFVIRALLESAGIDRVSIRAILEGSA